MEYIDGEDLASLLKRIGSLHGPKALDVAKQLCAGLAAAHDKGVLHRDLKPANIMIDGRGRVRITDFGLAVAAGEDMAEGDVSGTPPYMAPEQFAGKGASIRSDIYALGLIFYEVFTGRQAFHANTLAELRSKKETSPTAPSEIARDIDTIVERVILRCIEKDPRQRPASVAQVAAALPGGDPLSAAIAAGETPSPEMVAASGIKEGLRPWIAWACLSFIFLGMGLIVALKGNGDLCERVPIEKAPEVMGAKAQDILKELGYPNVTDDRAFGFESDSLYLEEIERNSQSSSRFDNLPASVIYFWYRQSPETLVHLAPVRTLKPAVTLTDPPFKNNGDSLVRLDSRGNLIGLHVIPVKGQKISGQRPDWTPLFRMAGIDQSKCNKEEPDLPLPVNEDYKEVWTGTLPDRPDIPIRIEAASRGGKPVWWNVTPILKGRSNPQKPSPPRIGLVILLLLVNFLPIIGAFFARRNLRMGRGDRRGAVRLSLLIFVLGIVSWILSEHHVASFYETGLFIESAALWLLSAGFVWLMYVSIEPFVRRRWPNVLVGWSRLLAGDYRDPLVGRDLLIGCVAGVLVALVYYLRFPADLLCNTPQTSPSQGSMLDMGSMEIFYLLSSDRALITNLLLRISSSVFIGLGVGFMLFILRILLRRTWAAVAVFFSSSSLLHIANLLRFPSYTL